ncbi:signal peptidase I [Leekyejoonella antrihumi]|uniref:Signal peptidase I n=1 Tax=Leekyejoonella antrihumi TaxID=1660198 RepID=A0A563DZE2_9MICO|nr:signal peptidase I [Leekyejoonella antrihumi]TWP35565.1 signal peptidase I [Leekyejoonella antrihumi]
MTHDENDHPMAPQEEDTQVSNGSTDDTGPSDPPGPGEAPAHKVAARKTSRRAFYREIATIVVIALALSFLVKTFLAQPYSIPSQSMENTLLPGDRIIVSKFTPQHSPLHRGDVIVFKRPTSWGPDPLPKPSALRQSISDALVFVGVLPGGGEHLVKRLIGLPGDRVKCCTKQGLLTVNGVAIHEPYIKPGNAPSIQTFDITVPAGRVWVMGDNRGDSADSRVHGKGATWGATGSVPMSDISGEVVAIAWPLSRIGSVNSYPKVFAKVPEPSPR